MKLSKLLYTILLLAISVSLAFGSGLSLQKHFGNPWLDATGGPDIYGYKWADSREDTVDYAWDDITAIGTEITDLGDDNYSGPYSLGFDFDYYWYTFNQVYVGSNGYLKVPPAANISSLFPATIPLTAPPNDYIAVYTMDLTFDEGGTCYWYTNSVDQFIVSWIDVPCWSTLGSHTFQVILDGTDNTITYNYGFQNGTTMNNDIIIGIENNNGQVGLLHSIDTYPPSDFTVKFYRPDSTTYEVHDLAINDVVNDGSQAIFIIRGEDYSPMAWVKNVGNQTEAGTSVTLRITDSNSIIVHEESVISSTLAAGESEELSFGTWTSGATGQYSVTASHNLLGDMNTANNSKIAEIDVVVIPGELSYDDDVFETAMAWNGETGGYGMYFEAPVMPAEITQIRYYIGGVGPPNTFTAQIVDNDGPGGIPGTILFETVVSIPTANLWYVVIVDPPIVVEDGTFFGVWEQMGSASSYMGLDQTAPFSRQTWEHAGGAWSFYREIENNDAGIRVMIGEGEIPYPVIETSVDTLEFPVTFVGDSAWLDLTISNIGTFGDLIIESIAFPLVPLNLVYNTEGFTPGMTIGPESNETITIRFTPPTPTTWQSNMTINSNASNGTAFVFCIGEGALSVGDNHEGAPVTFNLSQNVPNPFNPVTYIEYSIPAAGNVELVVYNSLGEEITKLVNGGVNAGYHKVAFDGSNLGSGIYFYRISANGFTEMKKMVLMK